MADSDVDLERLHDFIPFDCLSESHLRDIAGQIQVMKLAPARVLFKRGERSDMAYFLIAGAVDLIDAAFQVRKFPADDDENYLALDNYPEHTVNAISTENSIIYAIERDKLDLLMTWTQAAESMLEDDDDSSERDWMDALLTSELFSQIPPQKIQSLFVKFEEREVTLGEQVVKEGEPGDTFYVIKQGKAMVSRLQGNKQETLAALTTGNFFGEDALISDAPRNATVTMTSDGLLMSLGKEDFRLLLQDSVIRRITETQAEKMEEEGDRACVMLDVRLPMEFRHDRTGSARNIPLNELRRQVRSLEKDFVYVVCCDGGRRSELGAYLLTEAGLEAYVLERPKPQDADPEKAEQTNPA
ncbi:MAG: calcium-binding protein [Gammaproteobacteria bacterium HGW-Gammaproteobacteria-14]|nr:MAG: calcium-binding protein [Gammaproteobacteria bacterium HGW-Gammaproteobacteria-14]